MLPPNSDFRSTAHVIVGGRASGFAFTDRSDVAIRLDAFLSDSDDGPLDEGKLAALLCHELYHVGYRAAGGLPPRPDPPDSVWTRLATLYGPETVGEIWRATGSREWNAADVAARLEAWEPSGTWNHETFDRLLGFLARVQNEGCAVYADMPLRDDSGRGEPHGTEGWEEMVDDDFRSFERVVAALASGSSAAEIDALVSAGFAEDGPFYRVGYQMAERIDTRSGRRPFLATVSGGALEFFETYLETHPEGARKLARPRVPRERSASVRVPRATRSRRDRAPRAACP